MKYALLWLILLGCGREEVFREAHEQLAVDAVSQTADYFHAEMGIDPAWVTRTAHVWIGTQDAVAAKCGYPLGSIWSCNVNHQIYVSSDNGADVCWEVSHEVGHTVAMLCCGDWDENHERFGVEQRDRYVYLFPSEICAR